MKKFLLSIFALFCVIGCYAQVQVLKVTSGQVSYLFDSSVVGKMTFASGTDLTVLGKTFKLADLTVMKVTSAEVAANTVNVVYSGSGAEVTVSGDIAKFVDVVVEGAHVTVNQSAELSDTEGGEITYTLNGNASDGSFTLNGSYKATVELNGVDLTSSKGAALSIQNGKRIKIKVKEGTVNNLEDCTDGAQKGAITCKGHIEFSGKGSLTVKGNSGHAIHSKEYVTLKNAEINVTGALKDGLNCGQYFTMQSGTINISGTLDDGIQCGFKDDTDREPEDTGTITIAGGKISVIITGTATKALKADGNFIMSGGEINAETSGAGMWDSDKSKTKASACIGADGYVHIDGGTLILSASGGGGKGISCDGEFVMADGSLTVNTTGGMFAYTGGKEYQNYTGNADRLSSDSKSSPKGVKADGNVEIKGGTIDITTKGNGGEGIESKALLTIENGKIKVRAYDDAINSSSHMYIKGGDIDVVSSSNDGLDANGNMYISGGVVKAFGASSPECGIDVNEEERYTLYLTGGIILGVGGNNSVPSTSATTSTQAYVVVSKTVTAGSEVSIGTSASESYYKFTIPSDYKGSGTRSSSLLISVPQLVSGQTYTVVSGTSSTTSTARTTGGGSGPGGR